MDSISSVENLNETIKKYYRRNRSLVDTISKCQGSVEKAARSITKAATHCGCIEFCAKKQPPGLEEEVPILLSGKLCSGCQDEIEKNIGQSIFYLFSLCYVLGLDVEAIMEEEVQRVKTLGKFNLR